MQASNLDMTSLVTPVDVDKLEALLEQSSYDKVKSQRLIEGFRNGFNIGYSGPKIRQTLSRNHRLKVGTQLELWNKVMKEVAEKRFVGPLETVPFDNFLQSPLGKNYS